MRSKIAMMLLKRAARARVLITSNPTLLDLSKSAPIMEKLAGTYCKRNCLKNISCEWYHSSWQYFRILDAAPAPEWHSDFYKRNIYTLFKGTSELNILICGLADYAILSHVLDGCKIAKTKPKITLFDSCQTPVEICKWYLEKNAPTTEIDFKLGDILDFEFSTDNYDLITTDSYLTQFNRNEKTKIIDKWKRWLKPGGVLLTTGRMEKGLNELPTQSATPDINSPINREFNKTIERAMLVLSMINNRLKRKKPNYEINTRFHPFTNAKEIEDFFKDFNVKINIVITKRARLYAQIVGRTI